MSISTLQSLDASIPIVEAYDFHRADPLFQDHFPGKPVIPGSILVSCFHKTAGRRLIDTDFSSTWALREVINTRFVAFGEPGRIEVRMHGFARHGDDVLLDFSAFQNEKPLAHARLRYASRYGPSS